MKSYYKYTSGESFTLDDSDYYGFFHVNGEDAYTDRLSSVDTKLLTKKKTLISDIYTNKIELDNVYTNVNNIIPYYSNVFDVVNRQEIDKLTSSIEYNNLRMFAGGVIGNPYLYNLQKNNNHFYGFSVNDTDTNNLSAKNSFLDIVPFSYSVKWAFLDEIKDGVFVVNSDEDFKYICTTGTTNYILAGSFDTTGHMTILPNYPKYLHPDYTDNPDYTHSIHHDADNSKIIYVNNDFIEVYDSSNFYDCDELVLIDKIKLIPTENTEYIWNEVKLEFSKSTAKWGDRFTTINHNNPEFIKFGRNIRTSLDGKILSIIVKYSSTVYRTIDLSIFDIGDIIDLDVRVVDDNVIILNKKDDGLYVMVLDLEEISTETPKNTKIYSILPDMDWYKIKFSDVDSNIFYVSNPKEYQARYVTYPDYPYGRMEQGNLLYYDLFKWNEIFEQFGQTSIIFNNLTKKSNTFYNLVASETIKNEKMYTLLHNVGRIYALSQPIIDRYKCNVTIDLQKYFNPIKCSDTSIGLYFNTIILNNITDTLNIFNKTSGSFNFGEYTVDSSPITNLDYNIKDFYINGNETFNVSTIQRILMSVNKLQSKIIPTT